MFYLHFSWNDKFGKKAVLEHVTFEYQRQVWVSKIMRLSTLKARLTSLMYLPTGWCFFRNDDFTCLYACQIIPQKEHYCTFADRQNHHFEKKNHNINTVLAGLICDGNNPFYFSSNTCINLLMLRSNFLRLSYHGHFKWLQLL